MHFSCGKCGDTQALGTVLPVGAKPQKPDTDWGTTCQSCGFFGKSQLFFQAWQQSQQESAPQAAASVEPKKMSLERIESLVNKTGMMISNKLAQR